MLTAPLRPVEGDLCIEEKRWGEKKRPLKPISFS